MDDTAPHPPATPGVWRLLAEFAGSLALVFLLQWAALGFGRALMCTPGAFVFTALVVGAAPRGGPGRWLILALGIVAQSFADQLFRPVGFVAPVALGGLVAWALRPMLAPLLRDAWWRWGLAAAVVIAVNTLTHLSALSPMSYMLYGAPAEPYADLLDKGRYVVMGDHYHWQAVVAAMRPHNWFDPQYSLVLRRFMLPYIEALSPWQGQVWLLGVAFNAWLWVGTLGAVVRVGERLGLSERVVRASLIGFAAAWGLVVFVGQPMPYAASYLMVPWMVLAFLSLSEDAPLQERLLALAGIAAGVALYDMFHLVVAGLVFLLLRRRWGAFVAVVLVQVLVPMWWQLLTRYMLGTEGDLANARIMSRGIAEFKTALLTANLPQLWLWLRIALLNMGWSLLFLPALLVPVHLGVRTWQLRREPGERWFPVMLLLFTGAVVGAYFVLVPGMFSYSASGLLPRISYYPFLFALFATCWACERIHHRLVWLYPVLLVAMAQWDFWTGSQWLAQAFAFGH